MRSSLRKSLRASEAEALGEEPRRSKSSFLRNETRSRLYQSTDDVADVTPEEQAEQVRAHRLKLQAATTSIEESINRLYVPKNKGPPGAPVTKSDGKPINRLSLVAAAGDFKTVQEEQFGQGPDVQTTPEAAPNKEPRKLVSQRTSYLGERSVASSPERRTQSDEEGAELSSPGGDRRRSQDEEDQEDGGGSDESGDISSEAMLSDDSDLEHFDVVQSREKVNEFLDGLHIEERVEVMEFLNTWFTDRSNRINYDSEFLRRIEEERTREYMEAEAAFGSVGDKLEDTETKTVNMMRQMHDTLQQADIKPRKKKQRPKTGISDKEYEQLTMFHAAEDQNVQLEMAIEQLRTKLMEKEGEMRKAVQATGVESEASIKLETDELMRSLNKQQDEISDLQRQVAHGENRVRLLKAALDHLSMGAAETSLPDKDVSDIIREMREKVHDGKIQELLLKRDLEHGDDLKRPDEEELETLKEECEEMTNKLRLMEDDIARLRNPEMLDREIKEQLDAISGGQQPLTGSILDDIVSAEIQPERGPEVKVKLHNELSKAHEEEDKLKKQLEYYQQLCESSQQTLKTIEEQRDLFLDSVTLARTCHWGSEKEKKGGKTKHEDGQEAAKEDEGLMIDTSVHELFLEDESEDFNVEAIQKQDQVMAKLRQEELKLEEKIKELAEQNNDILEAIKNEEQTKKTMQEELNDATETYRKSAYPEQATPELIALVTQLGQGNRERLADIRFRRQKLCGFDVPDRGGSPRGGTKKHIEKTEAGDDSTGSPRRSPTAAFKVDEAADFEERIQAVKRAAEEQAAGAPMPVVDKTSLTQAMRSGSKPSEEELAQIMAMQCSKDLRELLDVQSENTKLAKEVAALEEQIRRVRQRRKEDNQEGESSLTNEKARELRQKQRELNALRAQWRARERVRQHKEAVEALLMEGVDDAEAEGGAEGGEEEIDELEPENMEAEGEDDQRRSSKGSIPGDHPEDESDTELHEVAV